MEMDKIKKGRLRKNRARTVHSSEAVIVDSLDESPDVFPYSGNCAPENGAEVP
jgi:hypothetical protein